MNNPHFKDIKFSTCPVKFRAASACKEMQWCSSKEIQFWKEDRLADIQQHPTGNVKGCVYMWEAWFPAGVLAPVAPRSKVQEWLWDQPSWVW